MKGSKSMDKERSRRFGWWLLRRQEAARHLRLAAQSLANSDRPIDWLPVYNMLYNANTEFLDAGITPNKYKISKE